MTTKKKKPTQAQRADRHDLYERAVQDVESEIDFVVQTWGELRKRPLRKLREDFSGTCATSCEFVRRGRTHEAWCVDIDDAVMDELLAVDPAAWRDEFASIREYIESFGDRVPPKLRAQLDAADQRLA